MGLSALPMPRAKRYAMAMKGTPHDDGRKPATKADMADLREAVKADIDGLREATKADMADLRKEMDKGFATQGKAIVHLEARIERVECAMVTKDDFERDRKSVV